MAESERIIDDSAEKVDAIPETGDTPATATACARVSYKHNALDITNEEKKTQASESSETLKKDPAEFQAPSLSMHSTPSTPVSSTVTSASMPPTPKVIVSSAPIRSATPLVVGARVVTGASTAAGASGQSSASHPGGITVMSNQVRPPAVAQAPLRASIVALPRASILQQNATVPRSSHTTSLQLPANFQIPQGMVLIRSDSGQLMLVSQQALAQAQAQGLVPKSSNVPSAVRPQAPQAAAPSIIRVSLPSSSTTVATIVKPTSSAPKAVLKPSSTTGTALIKSTSIGNTIIKPPSGLGTGLKPSSITGPTVIKSTSVQKPSISTSTGTISQRTITGTNVTSASIVKSINKTSLTSVNQVNCPVGSGPRNICPNIPIKTSSSSKVSTQVPVTAETLENVKKCKNFLITLMKLASSGTRSPDMAQNVRALVKDLLDGRLEAEEFTEKLYIELKSSPQPYLVPFLKRSLPAVRQLTPNSQLFIQQCEQPKSSTSFTICNSTQKLRLPPSTTITQPLRGSAPARPPQMVLQQAKGVIVEQHVTSSPHVVKPVQSHTQPKPPVIQTNTQLAAFRSQYPLQDSTSGSFRDDDDINDVASMAGVNLNEENARILASSSELVGTVVHSCRDELFLQTTALQQKVLHIGNSLGVTEVNTDVLGLLSHATQERLRDLLEKLSAIVQHHYVSYRDDWRNIQISDARSQLKFLEQLEKVKKQKREEEERETLLRIAKSRSSSEDPEQLRLKQRAKEMQQLELAQMEHRDANLAALAALGPRKRKPLETSGAGTNQVLGFRAQRTAQRVTVRDLIFCMEQDRALRHSLTLYHAFLR
ncbi:LOW QUALITY PROTEIN: transcription initiation factor TFIID subunit 4 [Silurus meridionalis]|uniref:LOW QUALITY PROTEIN: transcription initiation factor TFIID subunit 4 n=1 Tax=Silurus meridionalis TaxID=175797 RepID=UPI001EE9FAD5|nr:LOW QUALITY PROTEIN: transcription initiation factor TFIID subunit 4 [Silurus meridionalis]